MSVEGSESCRTGRPAFLAASTAADLSPVSSRTSAGGPMKVMPFSAHSRASWAFSERKP